MTDSQAGAGHSKKVRATSVVDDAKLDALSAQMTDLRVLVSQVAGDVKAVLARIDSIDRAIEDHEKRIRTLESHGTEDHSSEIQWLRGEVSNLREWRARLAGIAGGIGAVAGGGVAVAAKALGL